MSRSHVLPIELVQLISFYLPTRTITSLPRCHGLPYVLARASARTGLSMELLQTEMTSPGKSNVSAQDKLDLVLAKHNIVTEEFESNALINGRTRHHLIAQFGSAQQIKRCYHHFEVWDLYHTVVRHHDFGVILLPRLKNLSDGKKLAVVSFFSGDSIIQGQAIQMVKQDSKCHWSFYNTLMLLKGQSGINLLGIDDQMIAMRFLYEKNANTLIGYLNHAAKFGWISETERIILKAYMDDKFGWPIHVEWPSLQNIVDLQQLAWFLIQLKFVTAIRHYITEAAKSEQWVLKKLFLYLIGEIERTGHYQLFQVIIGCQVDFYCDEELDRSAIFSPFGHVLLSHLIESVTESKIIYRTGWQLKIPLVVQLKTTGLG